MLSAMSNSRHSRNDSAIRHKSGYEPSDTETEWHESPWNDAVLTSERTRLPKDPGRNTSNLRNNRTPPKVTEQRRQPSPYAGGRNEPRKKSSRTPPRFRSSMESFSRSSIKERFTRNRSTSTPKLRPHEKEHPARAPAFLGTNPVSAQSGKEIAVNVEDSIAENCSQEINELIANGKGPNSRYNEYAFTSTESIPTGDIFFSRDCRAPLEKISAKHNNNNKQFTSNSNAYAENDGGVINVSSGNLVQTSQFVSARAGLSRTTTKSSYATAGHPQISSTSTLSTPYNSGRLSGESAKFSDFTGKLVGGVMKFTSNMNKAQNDTWLPCVTGKSCRKSQPPSCKTNDESESGFIQNALVIEKIRLLWADKYCPRTLSGFTCHREQVQQLKQMVSLEYCPHIIFKGPPGSGRRSLCRAVLNEIFGESSLNVSHSLKSCNAQGSSSPPILIPLSSSDHHVELNMKSQSKNARYALMTLANEMARHKITEPSGRKNFKVLVLSDVDRVNENNQRLIKWIIDSSSDACKIIMICQDESNLLDSIKSRCKLITISAPDTSEIVDILTYISRKESFDLPANFAATIASQSRKNLREAILALEACKSNNYPFVDGQAIPLGWEDVLVELAEEILEDPSPKRLFLVRGKLQKILVEFVPPKLILQKLVELFLKGIQSGIKREVFYWHAYYDKRLPGGASALLKLEEFVAKFMSIHRKSLSVSS